MYLPWLFPPSTRLLLLVDLKLIIEIELTRSITKSVCDAMCMKYTKTTHLRTDTELLINSSPMVPSYTMPVLSPPVDLTISIRKGTHISRNPHSIYNFLTYHRLSSPYYAFISTLSSISLPNTMHESLFHPG